MAVENVNMTFCGKKKGQVLLKGRMSFLSVWVFRLGENRNILTVCFLWLWGEQELGGSSHHSQECSLNIWASSPHKKDLLKSPKQ